MLVLAFILLSLILGPLAQIPLANSEIHVYLPDIIAGGLAIYWITRLTELRKFIRDEAIAKWFIVFVSVALVSLLVTPISLLFDQRLISGLYLLRFASYFFYYVTIRSFIKSKQITSGQVVYTLILSGVALSLVGWFQYFLYPDLRNLFYLGWDPHLNRIFSTYFDPNFLGLILVFTLIVIWVRFGSFTSEEFHSTRYRSLRTTIRGGFRANVPMKYFFLLVFIFITLAFTYSRGSYLALLSATLYWSFSKRNLRLLGSVTAALILAAVLLPRSGGHGVLLERVYSIEQRIDNFREGFALFSHYSILGVGFNTVRYAKKTYGIVSDPLIEDHAAAGFDNSFLFVAATTGIIGLIFYILFLFKTFTVVGKLGKVSILAAVLHAMIVNSLFFPWIMLWLWVIVACDRVMESKKL